LVALPPTLPVAYGKVLHNDPKSQGIASQPSSPLYQKFNNGAVTAVGPTVLVWWHHSLLTMTPFYEFREFILKAGIIPVTTEELITRMHTSIKREQLSNKTAELNLKLTPRPCTASVFTNRACGLACRVAVENCLWLLKRWGAVARCPCLPVLHSHCMCHVCILVQGEAELYVIWPSLLRAAHRCSLHP
jgi:hypothetical protein